jgi:NADH:ubiquinone oxidoreductase subunit F (NADH-binding)
VVRRLLAGPESAIGFERLESHQRRLTPRPEGGRWLVDVLARSGLLGRGGGRFPTWRKWEAVAEHSSRHPVVVVNASEGEPLSAKDRTLLTLRPHLVLDGAALAADTLAAGEIVVYLSQGSRAARQAVRRAMKERRRARFAEPPIHIVETEHRYIAGESSAVVQRISGGPAKPRFTPPHPTDKGVGGHPTLVQNTETLAHVALIARFGSDWFRELGTESSPGTALMTLSGNIREPGVYEVDLAGRLEAVVEAAGGTTTQPPGALLGGYFGTWLPATALTDVTFDAQRLRSEHGASFGCGVLALLPEQGCGIVEASRILRYLAAQTAGQCGPCVNGLGDLSKAMARIAASQAEPSDLDRVRRWSAMVRGRGACHHPDGAVGQLASALEAFADHLGLHIAGHHCPGRRAGGFPAPPSAPRWWRW